LLTNLREQGLPTDRKYLFVIDGAKALRAGIEEVFGAEQPVQRCRNHKVRNVLDELPEDQQGQTLNLMRARFTLQKLQIPASLHTCLATTNLIESPQGGVQRRTDNVTRWRDQDMLQRCVASAWLLTEQHFRKILG
jgi:transposase-like protein